MIFLFKNKSPNIVPNIPQPPFQIFALTNASFQVEKCWIEMMFLWTASE